MSYNYTLRYKTFDQLMADILVDFKNYDLSDMIEPQELIKVAKRVNYDLGLRIMMTKPALLEVEKGRVKLPDDFYVLNFALLCDTKTVTTAVPQGTNIQEIPVSGVPPYQMTQSTIDPCTNGTVNCGCGVGNPCTCNSCCNGCHVNPCCCPPTTEPPCATTTDACTKPRLILNCKNECFELVQVVNTISTTYKRTVPVEIVNNPEFVDCNCPNIGIKAGVRAWIQNGFLFTNIDCGKIYIMYQGQLEDDEGNLLVPDHDMLNEYYEYALKKRVLENLIMNDESVNQAKIQLIEAGYRTSRNYALSIVNTPNFKELKNIHIANRRAMYARYYDMFKSRPTYDKNYNPAAY